MSAIVEDALSKLHGSPISDAESDVESVQEERFEKREPLLPGETSILRVVHVHLSRRRYNPNVDGFTFEYDDCSERTAGDASDWLDAKTLALEPGEHIVEVQPIFSISAQSPGSCSPPDDARPPPAGGTRRAEF